MDNYDVCQFIGKIKPIKQEEFDAFGISKGSIWETAKSLLPADFDPEQNIDVLPVVFNLATVNEFNKNGDGIDAKTAVAAVKRFINKPINIEHKKDKIVGHIINASFSEEEFDFQNNDIESYANKENPFYITAAGLIYRQIYPQLAEAIMESSDEEEESYQSISASWELAFRDYEVARGSKKLNESTIVSSEEKGKMSQYLKGMGGDGEDEDGVPINRLIIGQTFPLGAALTTNPAARVKGVYPAQMFGGDKKHNKISRNANINVSSDKFKTIFNMEKEQFNELMSKVAESVASVVRKDSEAKTIGEIMRDALTEHSESWKSKIALEREAKEKSEADLAEIKNSLKDTKDELEKLKSEAAAQSAVDLFNARMNNIDAEYDFTEKELGLVTAEVKDLASDDEAFADYKEKLEIVFAHKMKSNLEAQEAEIKARIQEAIAKRTEGEDEDGDEDGEKEGDEELEVEASGDAEEVPNNNAEASTRISFVERLKENFSVEVTN
jgi:hypothetical protein